MLPLTWNFTHDLAATHRSLRSDYRRAITIAGVDRIASKTAFFAQTCEHSGLLPVTGLHVSFRPRLVGSVAEGPRC